MNIIILLSRVVFLRFLLWLLPLNLLLSPVDGSSDDYRLWCYRGLKYHIGQEVRQDNTECTSKFGFKPYCYRFVGQAALAPEVVKIGCATALCAGIRNHCATIELQGVTGQLCCCNTQSYCNSTSSMTGDALLALSSLLITFLVVICAV